MTRAILPRMARPKRCTPEELIQLARRVPLWNATPERLRREWKFADFGSAFAFMTRVAFLAEKADHHPDWSNAYSRVAIELRTHDAGGVSALDFGLAEEIDRLGST